MQKDLFKKINEVMPKLSKGHKSIGKYIIEHYDKAAYMTASKLGTVVGISESTVVRFATELGFDGYPALQREMQDLIKNKLTSVQRIEVTNGLIGNKNILENVLNHDIEKIRKTLEESNINNFNKAVDTIASAKRIYILGSRSAASLAKFLAYYLNLIFPNIKHIHTTSTSEMFEQIVRINEDDVIIGISFPRYSTHTVKAFKYASDNKAKVIAITDSNSSPLVQYADIPLFARSDMVSFVDSLVAPLSLINALIVAVSIKNKEKVSENLDKLENIWAEYQVYEKFEEK